MSVLEPALLIVFIAVLVTAVFVILLPMASVAL